MSGFTSGRHETAQSRGARERRLSAVCMARINHSRHGPIADDGDRQGVINRPRQRRGRIGQPRKDATVAPLEVDDALLAVLIGAIHANDHMSADEGARAHHLIWSTRRFRHKSGDVVNRQIDRLRQLMERRGTSEVVEVAARALPPRLRKSAFAVAADLILVDGKLEGSERRFLTELALNLGLDKETTATILDVIVVKNSI